MDSFPQRSISFSGKAIQLASLPRRIHDNSRVELRLPKKAAGAVVVASPIPRPPRCIGRVACCHVKSFKEECMTDSKEQRRPKSNFLKAS